MKRYKIIADNVVINHAWTPEKARKIANDYLYQCSEEDIPFYPEMEIEEEEIE